MQLVQFPLSHRVTTVVFVASPWDGQPAACSSVISVARLSSWLTHTLSSLHVEPWHYPPFLSFITRSVSICLTHPLVTLQKIPCPCKMLSNSFSTLSSFLFTVSFSPLQCLTSAENNVPSSFFTFPVQNKHSLTFGWELSHKKVGRSKIFNPEWPNGMQHWIWIEFA